MKTEILIHSAELGPKAKTPLGRGPWKAAQLLPLGCLHTPGRFAHHSLSLVLRPSSLTSLESPCELGRLSQAKRVCWACSVLYLIWFWEFPGCFLGVIALNMSSPGSLEDQRPSSLQLQLNRHAKGSPAERPPHAPGGKSIMDAVLSIICYCLSVTWPSQTAPRWSYNILQWAVPHKDCPMLFLRFTTA